MLGTAIFSGPVSWLVALQSAYVLSYAPCRGAGLLPLYVALSCAFLASVAGCWLAASLRRRIPTDASEWARLLPMAGIGLGLWSALVIAATLAPALVLHPCR